MGNILNKNQNSHPITKGSIMTSVPIKERISNIWYATDFLGTISVRNMTLLVIAVLMCLA